MSNEELLQQLESERAASAQLAAELAKHQLAVEQLKANNAALAPLSVQGEITLEFPIEGKKVKKTYTIADGAVRMWSPKGNLVPTEKVVALANGKTLSAADMDSYQHLSEFVDPITQKDNGTAKGFLTELAQRGASILVEKI